MRIESEPTITTAEVHEGLSEIETSTLGKEFDERETIPEKDIDAVLKGIEEVSGLHTQEDLEKQIPTPTPEKVTLGQKILSEYGFEMLNRCPTGRGLPEDVIIENMTHADFPRYFFTGLIEKVSEILQKDGEHKEIAKIVTLQNTEKIVVAESEQDNYNFLAFEVSVVEKSWLRSKTHTIRFNMDVLGTITIVH